MIKLLSSRWNLVRSNAGRFVIHQSRLYANGKSQPNVKPIDRSEFANDLGHFDIVINGGGIVGLTFLLNLQTSAILSRKRILLIEQQNQPKLANHPSTGERVLSNRVSSLTEASRQCLERNGVWPEIDQYAKRIREMQIWSSDLAKAISFDTDDLDGGAPEGVCYILENGLILNALNRRLNHDQVLYSTNVVDLEEIDGDRIGLYMQSRSESGQASRLTCSLLVGCDGFNSLVRQKSNLNYFNLPLEQSGVVGTVTMSPSAENPHNSISFQRFLPDRTVVAILPLTDQESSFVISTSKEFAKQLVEMDEQRFVEQFNGLLDREVEQDLPNLIRSLEQLAVKSLPASLIESTRNRILPRVSAVQSKSRAAFPLGFGTTLPGLVGGIRNSSNINLSIIGDSAHRVHPLAGQGLNLGIGDAIVLSNCFNAALDRGEELFGQGTGCPLERERLANALNEFEKQRQLKLIAMMSTIQAMQDLFACTPPALLNAFDRMSWIKKQMVAFANSV